MYAFWQLFIVFVVAITIIVLCEVFEIDEV